MVSLMATGDWILVFASIFGGCCSNVYALESLVRQVPKCGNLITFGQFIFITLVGLFSHTHRPNGSWVPRLRPRQVPLQRWMVMVGLYFGVSALNNMAFGFKVSIPLHIVFRSSGLIANMVCGVLVMNKRYPVKQVVAVVMVSVGVVVATMSNIVGPEGDREDDVGGAESTTGFGAHGYQINESVVGIIFLSLSVVLAALLGLYQESTYIKYGKHWQEGLFYNHLLALPMFILFRHDIRRQLVAVSQSPPLLHTLDGLPCIGYLPQWLLNSPSLWLALAINVFSQLVCASGVHKLTTMSTSLTLNVVLNFRKLVSLILSVVIFSNPVSLGMVCGCALVFVGTFAYSQSSGGRKPAGASMPVPKALEVSSSSSSFSSGSGSGSGKQPEPHQTHSTLTKRRVKRTD
ncbi:golgi uridine diphosphate-N- acetylglucosamine transporter [Coemansia sp. RSA 1200]|nr:golgi uridine diphosphate-N- acetylglucosamine transporter [Coemansia sp. RSA 1200]